DEQRLDGEASHALGGIDSKADRLFGLIEIDDYAGFHAHRLLVADADDLDLVGAPRKPLAFLAGLQATDDTAHLGRANVEHGDDTGAARRNIRFTAQPAHTRRSAGR